ncbi:MAG TPA: hypothetical protein VG125_06080 [Pirellulales bacterium]|nr:hypothetical protein [Pirellulales bacterium]
MVGGVEADGHGLRGGGRECDGKRQRAVGFRLGGASDADRRLAVVRLENRACGAAAPGGVAAGSQVGDECELLLWRAVERVGVDGDRQLSGRCGRQGDPGSYRQYVALDDDLLLSGLGPERAAWLAEYGRTSGRPFDHLLWVFRKAQRAVERRHFRQRRGLLHWEKQRKKLQREIGQDPWTDSTA